MAKRMPSGESHAQLTLDDLAEQVPLACAAPTANFPQGKTGTGAGIRAHYAAGDIPCEPCRQGRRDEIAAQRDRRAECRDGEPACETATKKYPNGRTGTSAGYDAHRGVGEAACAACIAAQTAKSIARRRGLSPTERARWRKSNADAARRRKERAPGVVRETKHRRMAKSREIIRAAKDRPCHDCGVRYPYYVMQFDHRDRSEKLFNIGPVGPTSGVDRLRTEIAKCDIVCANCHSERTYQENQRLKRGRDAETAAQAGDAA